MRGSFSIGRQLALGISIVLGLVVAMAAIGLVRLNASKVETRAMLDVPLKKERLFSDWYAVVNAGARRAVAIARSADPALASFFADDAKTSSARSTEIQNAIEALLTGDDEKQLFAAIGVHRKEFIRLRDRIMASKREGHDQEAMAMLEREFQPAAAAYLGSMTDLVKLRRRELDTRSAALEATNERSSVLLWLLAALALAVGAGVSWAITQRIAGPLRDASRAAQLVANGDLTTPLASDRSDEMGALLRALEHMRLQLVAVVAQVRDNAQRVLTASSEIAQGNLDLSQRTERQAASLQETASAMEQLSATVQRNANNVDQANQFGLDAAAVAVRGGAAVRQVVDTMREIQESSRRINEIIATIDGIAFQTNILALNAAVEAARSVHSARRRAGGAGRCRRRPWARSWARSCV